MKRLTRSASRLIVAAVMQYAATRFCSGQTNSAQKFQHIYCDNDSGTVVCHKSNDVPAAARPAAAVPAPEAINHDDPQTAPMADVAHDTKRATETSSTEEMEIAVEINGKRVGDFERMVRVRDGGFYASAEQFAQWRLPVPKEKPLTVDGETFYPLDTLKESKWDFNSNEQLLSLLIPASDFATTVLDVMRQDPYKAAIPHPGIFLNHQLQMSRVQQNFGLSGLFETGFFSKFGLVTSRFVEREFTVAQAPVRLDTQFVREFPEHRAKLVVGDTVSSSGPWAQQVNFGGISWTTDFTSQPGFLSLSLPNVTGEATLPSTVDIYVNNVRTAGQSIDAGPFAIKDIPVITPEGNISMVITDVLGRQQIVTQSYITTRELLRQGVSQYTYELGSMRHGVGVLSNGYGTAFFDGTHRYGLTKSLTVNGRVEVLLHSQTVGGGVDYALKNFGLLSGGFAADHGPSALGPGGLAYVSFSRRSANFGYSGTLQTTSSTFRQIGLEDNERAAKLTAQAQVSRQTWKSSTIAIGYLRQENRLSTGPGILPKPDFSGITMSYSMPIKRRAFLTCAANLSHSFKDASSATVTLVVPLGMRNSLVASSVVQGGSQSTTVDYTKQLPVGTGYGYHLRNSITDHNQITADATYQNRNGMYQIESSQIGSELDWRGTETGSLIFLDNHFVPSRWLNDSFAIVEVPDTPSIKIFENHQYVTATDHRGLAVLPGLVPFSRNTIYVNDQDVPLDTGMDFAEKTIVPMPRSGIFLKFATTKLNGALFDLVTKDGEPVPLGAEVTVDGDNQIYAVALRGEVFINQVSFPAKLHVKWEGDAPHKCEVTVKIGGQSEVLPRIGPVLCEEKQ